MGKVKGEDTNESYLPLCRSRSIKEKGDVISKPNTKYHHIETRKKREKKRMDYANVKVRVEESTACDYTLA